MEHTTGAAPNRQARLLKLGATSSAFFIPIILAAAYLNMGQTCCGSTCPPPPPPGPCDGHDPSVNILPSGAAGRLEGEFAVRSGAATYRVPLDVPAGIDGFAPRLALGYNSNSGNGLLGVGWSLIGASKIHRCAATIAHDDEAGGVGADGGDRFCLDGRRMVVVAGTYGASNAEYRFEEDTNVRIFSRGSSYESAPFYFEVHYPDGRRAYYGDYGINPSAAVDRVSYLTDGSNPSRTVRWEWLIGKQVNRHQNAPPIEYEYTEPGEDFPDPPLMTSIRYGSRRVVLEYEARTDFHERHRAGMSFRRIVRLKRLKMYATKADGSEGLGWKYELTYEYSPSTERSRLAQVTKCDGAGQCLPPTLFTWSNQAEGFDTVWTGEGVNSDGAEFHVGDWNGDGKSDILYADRHPDNDNLQVWFVRLATDYGLGPRSEITFGDTYPWAAIQRTVFPVDIDGDGKTEVLARNHRPGGYDGTEYDYGWHFWSWDQGQFEIYPVTPWYEDGIHEFGVLPADIRGFLYPFSLGPVPVAVLDVNGDRTLDLLYAFRCTQEVNDPCREGPEPWPTWSNWLGDNMGILSLRLGDGRGDFGPIMLFPQHPIESAEIYPVQLDADPAMEWLVANTESDSTTSDLRAFEYHDSQIHELSQFPAAASIRLGLTEYQGGNHVLDSNGDGLSEFFVEAWEFTNFTPPGLFTHDGVAWNWGFPSTVPGFYYQPSSSYDYTWSRVIDYDGDGLDDLVNAPRYYWSPGEYLESIGLGINVFPSRNGTYPTYEEFLSAPSPYSWGGNDQLQVGDFNGDGLQDLAYENSSSPDYPWDPQYRELVLLLRRGPYPDRVVGIEDGWGVETEIEYAPYTDTNVYEPRSDCGHPAYCVHRGPLLVAAYQTRHGTGFDEMRRFEMHYKGARIDLHGRGWIGFDEVRTVDVRGSTDRTVIYGWGPQDGRYPYAQRPNLIVTNVDLVGGTDHRTYDYRYYDYQEGHGGATYTVRPYYRHELEYEYPHTGGTRLVRQAQTELLGYDGYGNARRTVHTVTGGDTTTIVRDFQNDTSRWLIGLVTDEEITSTTPSNGSAARTRTMAYTADGALESETLAPGTELEKKTLWGRDAWGRVNTITATASGEPPRVTTLEYDDTSDVYVEEITNAAGHLTTQCMHPALGVATKEVGSNGLTTARQYDGFGRIRSESGPDGSHTSWAYEVGDTETPWVVTVTGNDGSWAKFEHDVLGRPVSERHRVYENLADDTREVVTERKWDSLGRVSHVYEPRYVDEPQTNSTVIGYDKLNRVLFTVNSQGSRNWEYDARTVTVTDQRGVSHVREHDALGRVVRSEVNGPNDPPGEATFFEYGPFGQLRFVTRGNAVETYTHEPERGFLESVSDPDAGDRTYRYNGFGEVKSTEDTTTGVTSFEYDTLGRVLERQRAEGLSTFWYDATPVSRGQLSGATSEDGITTEYHYNDKGQIAFNRVVVDGESFEVASIYDAVGRLSQTDYPTVADGQRFSLVHKYSDQGYYYNSRSTDNWFEPGWVGWTIGTRDAAGRPSLTYIGWDLVQESLYEPFSGRPASLRTTNTDDEIVQDLAYTWEPSGLLTRRRDNLFGRQEDFYYDDQRRLKTWSTKIFNTTDLHNYDYDALGNLTYYDGKTQEYTDPSHPHQLSKSGADSSYRYDDRGRMTQGGGRFVTPTSFDLPRSITRDGVTTTFRYDAFNRRVVKESPSGKTIYVGDLYEKRTLDGVTRHVHHMPGIAQVTWTETNVAGVFQKDATYILADHLGSTSVLADAFDGTVLEYRQFTPFGRRMDEEGQVFPTGSPDQFHAGFTGHEHDDELALVNMRGRMYDPESGRMLSPDPFVSDTTDTQSWNPYSYVSNSPLSEVDPTGFFAGLFFEETATILGGLLWGGASGGFFLGGLSVFPDLGFNPNPDIVDPTPPPELWDTETNWELVEPEASDFGPTTSGYATRSGSAPATTRGVVPTVNGVLAGGIFAAGATGAGYVLATGATAGMVAAVSPALMVVGLGALAAAVITAFDSGAVDAVIDGNATFEEGFLVGEIGAGIAAAPVVAMAAARSASSGVVRHGPLNRGPLPEAVANTFRGGSYTANKLSEATTLYRVYGGKAGQVGGYWTRTKPAGPYQSIIDSALNPRWGNTATDVATIRVPAGTMIYEGAAAGQGGLVGGGSQVFIPNVDPAWLVP